MDSQRLRKTELRTELRSETALFLVRKIMVRKVVRSKTGYIFFWLTEARLTAWLTEKRLRKDLLRSDVRSKNDG